MVKPDNIEIFPYGKIDPKLLLEKAKDWEMTEVIICGLDKNGEYIGGSTHDSWRDVLWLMKLAERNMEQNIFGDD